jgi:hypothetical protein
MPAVERTPEGYQKHITWDFEEKAMLGILVSLLAGCVYWVVIPFLESTTKQWGI